jgi:hypothetical protein
LKTKETLLVGKLLRENLTVPEIVKTNPTISAQFVYRTAKNIGVKPFKRGKWDSQIVFLRKLKDSGLSYREIVSQLGLTISRQRLQQAITRVPKAGFGKCHDCGQIANLERHHVDYSNDKVEYVCRDCHCKKRRISRLEIRVLELIKLGHKPHEIRKALCVISSTITGILRRNSIPCFKRGRITNEPNRRN